MKRYKLPNYGIYVLTLRVQSTSTANTPYVVNFGRYVEWWGAYNGNTGATQQLYLNFPDSSAFHMFTYAAETPGTGSINIITSGSQLVINTNSNLVLKKPIVCRQFILRTINTTSLISFSFLVSERK